MVITGPLRSLEGSLSTVEGQAHLCVFFSSLLNSTLRAKLIQNIILSSMGPSGFKIYESLGGEYSLGYSSMLAVKNELHKLKKENIQRDFKKKFYHYQCYSVFLTVFFFLQYFFKHMSLFIM